MILNKFSNSPHTRANVLQSALPGLLIAVVVLLARQVGMLEPLELIAFDYFLRLRPIEEPDDRITILEINAQDVEALEGYPLPTSQLVDLIHTIQAHNPRVVGFNILPDLLDSSTESEIYQLAEQYPNLVFTEKILPPQLKPISEIPESQMGFSDIYLDRDAHIRRVILGTPDPTSLDDYKFSFSARISELFLKPEGYALENGIRDPQAMRFGTVEIPRFTTNFGGYINADDGGIQTLINFRNSPSPFQTLTMNDIWGRNIHSELIKDRIIIFGVTDPRVRPAIATKTARNVESQELEGIVIQAHAISQLTSAVLDNRQLLNTIPEAIEIIWILIWGFIGTLFWVFTQPPKVILAGTLMSLGIIILVGYSVFTLGLWMPYTYPVIIIVINGYWNSILSNYQGFRARLTEQNKILVVRQEIIDSTFTFLHNGPLQNISSIRRSLTYSNKYCDYDFDKSTHKYLIEKIDELERGIRKIGSSLEEISLAGKEGIFYLGDGSKLNLNAPVHELFYNIFDTTLNRQLEGYKTLRWKCRLFDPIIETSLDIETKKELCKFLENMLLNVGKHSIRATKVIATGKLIDGFYKLGVEDDGDNCSSTLVLHKGEGTKQAENLSKNLNGEFKQFVCAPGGFHSELSWKVR